jgi:hypothetical protein
MLVAQHALLRIQLASTGWPTRHAAFAMLLLYFFDSCLLSAGLLLLVAAAVLAKAEADDALPGKHQLQQQQPATTVGDLLCSCFEHEQLLLHAACALVRSTANIRRTHV